MVQVQSLIQLGWSYSNKYVLCKSCFLFLRRLDVSQVCGQKLGTPGDHLELGQRRDQLEVEWENGSLCFVPLSLVDDLGSPSIAKASRRCMGRASWLHH
jgi:hypothetical protein